MKITLKIQRFNKEKDEKPYFQEFELEAEPTDRLLDALMSVVTNLDGSLGLRKSCAHGICGSDAMVINGIERLACKTLIKDVADDNNSAITVEPLRCMPVQKDLMVDQGRFFETYRAVKPFLINEEPADGKERIQTPEERSRFDDATKCILCAACYSSCPVIQEKNPAFIGPAAVVNAARFLFDSRDRGMEERLPVLNDENGVWPCENHFNCTRVCPRDIKVTKNINLTKREIKNYNVQQ
ncbi:MAG: succinate dehydrogenase iron-sulfur subunit [Spirochaetes bacterium RBG_16_49_21]|nr:MAG: succinate dehydrogenase iron-sulfur subunit [Spirochaetes bacterium RBG_16_49_21]